MTAVKDYFYLVTIDPYATLLSQASRADGPRYKQELRDFFGEHAHAGQSRFALSKEQLALFFYLRCRMGAANGVRDLGMKRASKLPMETVIDLRQGSQPACDDPEPVIPTTVELAKQLAQVDALLVSLADGKPLSIGGLELNSDHMVKVLSVQRQHLRAQLIASVNIPAV